MLSYEICIKLKEAGFPQSFPKLAEGGKEMVYVPTLSELIETCGTKDGFILQWQADENGWFCTNYFDYLQGRGTSPEEAVAKLYISLNNKK